jgi:hypothetical protein
MRTPMTAPPRRVREARVRRTRRLRAQVPRSLRRRLSLDAENAKLAAQVGVRISWIH